MKLVPPGYPYFTPPPMESMARAGPNSPQWWSDTGPSWNPATGLDIHGNYGGPIGTSGPMDAWGGPRGDAQNIANGWGFMNPAGQPAPQFSGGQNNAATVEPSQARPAPQFSGGQNNAATGSSTALPPQIGQQKFGDSGIGSLGGGGQTNVSLNLQGSATMNPQGANQNSGQGQRTMMFAGGGPTQINVSNEPDALLQNLYFDPTQVGASGNVAPSVDYFAYGKKNKDFGAEVTAPFGAGNITAGVGSESGAPKATLKTYQNVGGMDLSALVEKIKGQRATMNARADIPMNKGSAYIQGQRDASGNTLSAGMQRQFLGGDLSVGVNRTPGGTQGNIGYRANFAHGGLTSLRHNAAAVTAQGRGGDDTLLHVNKKELAGLASLLGRPLTINPHTGLHEAFGLKNILPMAAAALATYFTGGMAAPLVAGAAGAASGGTALLMGAKPQDALMQGLLAAGTAGIGAGLGSVGQGVADTATTTAANEAAANAVAQLPPPVEPLVPPPVEPPKVVGVGIEDPGMQNIINAKTASNVLPVTDKPLIALGNTTQAEADIANNVARREAIESANNAQPRIQNAEKFGSQRLGNVYAGLQQPDALKNAIMSPYGAMTGIGAYGVLNKQQDFVPPKERESNYEALDPYERKAQFPSVYNPKAEFNYFPGDRYARAAGGGSTSDIANNSMAKGGIAAFDKGGAATAIRNIRRMYKTRADASQAGVDPYMLDYAFGKGEIIGKGDGMSDSIPAVINGPRPQRAALADGEFVIPADVVSGLGNGSTKAGSDHLYRLMDRVRQERTGTKKQGKQIKAEDLLPA